MKKVMQKYWPRVREQAKSKELPNVRINCKGLKKLSKYIIR
jgi:hypothetical protein